MSRLDEIEKHCRSSLAAGPDAKADDMLWLVARVRALEATLSKIAHMVHVSNPITGHAVRTEVMEALAAGEAVDAPVGDEKFERMMRDGGWERAGEAG